MKIINNAANLGPLLAALALLPIVAPATAQSQVAFTGTETGTFISDLQPFQFPIATDGATAEGNATLIGHYTMTGNFVANVVLGKAGGTFTMTADNGDELFLDVQGGVLPADHSQVLWNETITGGTGRFDRATGSFTSEVQLQAVVGSLSPNPYTATLSGSISTVPEGGTIPAGLFLLGFTICSSLARRRVANARCAPSNKTISLLV